MKAKIILIMENKFFHNIRGLSMRPFCLVILLSLLIGCASPIINYEEPDDTNAASIVYDVDLWGVFPFGKKISTWYYSGCFDSDWNSENVLGKKVISEEGFNQDPIQINAGKKIYISFGLPDFCYINYGFTPKPSEMYVATYNSKFGHCVGSLSKVIDGKKVAVQDAEFFKLSPVAAALGSRHEWRRCSNWKNHKN